MFRLANCWQGLQAATQQLWNVIWLLWIAPSQVKSSRLAQLSSCIDALLDMMDLAVNEAGDQHATGQAVALSSVVYTAANALNVDQTWLARLMVSAEGSRFSEQNFPVLIYAQQQIVNHQEALLKTAEQELNAFVTAFQEQEAKKKKKKSRLVVEKILSPEELAFRASKQEMELKIQQLVSARDLEREKLAELEETYGTLSRSVNKSLQALNSCHDLVEILARQKRQPRVVCQALQEAGDFLLASGDLNAARKNWLEVLDNAYSTLNCCSALAKLTLHSSGVNEQQAVDYALMGAAIFTRFYCCSFFTMENPFWMKPSESVEDSTRTWEELQVRRVRADFHLQLSYLAFFEGDWNASKASSLDAIAEINLIPLEVQLELDQKLKFSLVLSRGTFLAQCRTHYRSALETAQLAIEETRVTGEEYLRQQLKMQRLQAAVFLGEREKSEIELLSLREDALAMHTSVSLTQDAHVQAAFHYLNLALEVQKHESVLFDTLELQNGSVSSVEKLPASVCISINAQSETEEGGATAQSNSKAPSDLAPALAMGSGDSINSKFTFYFTLGTAKVSIVEGSPAAGNDEAKIRMEKFASSPLLSKRCDVDRQSVQHLKAALSSLRTQMEDEDSLLIERNSFPSMLHLALRQIQHLFRLHVSEGEDRDTENLLDRFGTPIFIECTLEGVRRLEDLFSINKGVNITDNELCYFLRDLLD
eukprot:jgi/Phyca11/18874/fgenesh1_pg.PHYCAscaffold_41_\